jgi:transcriptional regulator with XRE-family HTH domain
MDVNFIRDRISQLRTNQGISEYKMSLDLGHSKSYVQSISSGRALPSMSEFLYICEYLGVTPKEFFDGDVAEPQIIQQLVNHALLLSPDDLLLLVDLAKRLEAKK